MKILSSKHFDVSMILAKANKLVNFYDLILFYKLCKKAMQKLLFS